LDLFWQSIPPWLAVIELIRCQASEGMLRWSISQVTKWRWCCTLDVALMNEKVTFQKNAVVTDAIGNHVNAWEDFYSCSATIGEQTGH
jgi:hypothetical protein